MAGNVLAALSSARLQRDTVLAHGPTAKGLRAFTRYAWDKAQPGSARLWNWHHDAVCEHLAAVSRREIRDLVINIPPGCTKSLLTCVFWPVWEWIFFPGRRWFFASFDPDLTLRDSRYALQILQSPWFSECFGERVSVAKSVAASNFENLQGGSRFSTSVGAKATGHHPDTKVVDDPSKPLKISKTTLEEVERWDSGTMSTRARDPKTVANVLIMQRLHERDLAARRIKLGAVLLCLPMEFREKSRCVTPWARDPRTQEGELLWPERADKAEIAKLKIELGPRNAAAQLNQDPIPEGGAVFKREWFRHWKTPPERFDRLVQSWDCTFKDESDSDWVVGQVWGKVGATYYLLDQIRERLNVLGTCAAIKQMRARWPRASTILVEDKANGPAVIKILEKQVEGLVAVNPEGGKVSRANAIAGLFEAGNVEAPPLEGSRLGDDGRFRDGNWVEDWIEELVAFPLGKHDDQVDATSQALVYLYQRGASLDAAMSAIQGASEVDMAKIFGG